MSTNKSLKKSHDFEDGQAYVALTRAKSRENVKILNFDSKKFRTNIDVKIFYRRQKNNYFTVCNNDLRKTALLTKKNLQRFCFSSPVNEREDDEDSVTTLGSKVSLATRKRIMSAR